MNVCVKCHKNNKIEHFHKHTGHNSKNFKYWSYFTNFKHNFSRNEHLKLNDGPLTKFNDDHRKKNINNGCHKNCRS